MQREQHVAVWLRMLAESEIAMARHCNSLLKAQGARAASAYAENASIPSVEEAIDKGKSDWLKVLVAHYSVTIKKFSNYTNEQLTGTPSKNFQNRIQTFIAKQGLDKSTLITGSTKDIAKSIIMDGQENGDSEAEIGKALRDGIGIDDSRARTIARTETHAAATYGMQETAEEVQTQTGMDMTREWVAVEDARTREAHSEADGQEVGMDEPFIVDDEELDRPGDPSGSPENVINCRCTVVYHITDSSGNETETTDDGDDIGAGGFIGDD